MKKKFTPSPTSEWLNRLNRAVTSYNSSVFQLSQLVKEGKLLYGKKAVHLLTPLDMAKIDWLLYISQVPVNPKLLPEHHYEAAFVKPSSRWLKKAAKNNWKPSQLRLAIRKTQKQFKADKKVSVAKWPKAILQAEHEIKNLSAEQRQNALAYITKTFGL